MKKRNIIVSAVLTIALCLGVIAGSTYALFTDKATPVNVAVTSATVDIEANVSSLNYYSYNPNLGASTGGYDHLGSLTSGQTGEFVNKGTVSVTNNEITLDRVTPGDRIEFDIVVTNKSNVATKVRTVFSTEEPQDQQTIFADDGIVITSTVDGATLTSDGVDLAPSNDTVNGQVVRTIHVIIEFKYLPEDQNHHQNKSGIKISYLVEAVQSNGAFAN